MENQAKYVLDEACPLNGGSIPKGTEIYIVNGCIYVNGGMVDPFYQNEIMNAIARERKPGYQGKKYFIKMSMIENQL